MADPKWAVQAPDGKVIQFPDNFTDADVNREMSKMYPQKTSGGAPNVNSTTGIAAPQGTESGFGSFGQGLRDFGSALWGDVKSAFSQPPSGVSPYPGMDIEGKENLAEQSRQALQGEKQAGYGLPYRVAATFARSSPVPINVAGMEESAAQGSQSGVMGHALAPLAVAGTAKLGTKVVTEFPKAAVDFINRANTKPMVEKNAAGIWKNNVRDPLIQLKELAHSRGDQIIQQAIAADKQSSVAGQGSIDIAPVVTEIANSLNKSKGTLTPAEQAIIDKVSGKINPLVDQTAKTYFGNTWDKLNPTQREGLMRMLPDDIKPASVDPNNRLSLEEAKTLRTKVGKVAFGRGTPESKAVFRDAYNALGERGMKPRIQALAGSAAPYDDYNEHHKVGFDISENGVTSHMLNEISDQSEAIDRLKELRDKGFGEEVKKNAKTYGMDPDKFDQAEEDARAAVAAHDSVTGKYRKSAVRLALTGGSLATATAVSMMAVARGAGLAGLAPMLIASYVTGKVMGTGDEMRAGATLRKIGIDPNAPYFTQMMQQFGVKPGLEEPFRIRPKAPEATDYNFAAGQSPQTPSGPYTPPPRPESPTQPAEPPITPESQAADVQKLMEMRRSAMPQRQANPAMPSSEEALWQKSVFGKEPEPDIGAKVRAANPEPTRKEVKAAAIKKAKNR